MFGRRPQLPIDLLFPTRREHNLTHTIDEYVKTLYKHLWKSVKITQDSALKEALWQKCLYDHKVGAVELRPGRPCTGEAGHFSRSAAEAEEPVGK